jgi:hypothetical protein
MVYITRFPFFFWGIKNEPDAIVDENYIVKGDKRYEIRKASVWIFLFAKYFLILAGLIFTFSRFDFVFSIEKLLQYTIALALVFLTLILPKKFMGALVVIAAVLLVTAIVLGELYFISFIFKYYIVFFIFFMVLLDSKKTHYYLLSNDRKIVANVIIED